MNFARILHEVGGRLDQSGIRWGIAGAFALHAYGLTRATADLDLVVEARARPALVAFLEALGYETLHQSEGFSNHLHPLGPFGRLDFIYVDERTADELFSKATQVELFPGHRVRVPSPEHLAAMKVLALKNDPTRTFRELADIQSLLTLPGVDAGAIERTFVQHGLREKFDELARLSRGS